MITMATKISIIFLTIILSLLITCSATDLPRLRHVRRPCKKFTVYLHETRYNGSNLANATSAIVGEPAWGNKTNLASTTRFGDLITFDNLLTKDNNTLSSPVGRAQGFYLYDNNKGLGAWHGFSMVFNNTKYKGSLTLAGENPLLMKTRDISVIGGTDDFFMHRGIATFETAYVDGLISYGLKVTVKLYEAGAYLNNFNYMPIPHNNKPMAAKTFTIPFLVILILSLLIVCSTAEFPQLRHVRRPCKRFVVYYHDLRYNGTNRDNATSAIVGEPDWALNKTKLARPTFFGDILTFDDPLTEDNNFTSPPVGRAQGFYLYDGKKDPGAWHGFSMVFNSTKYKGSLNIVGQNLITPETRDVSVTGGTGDFLMHRGIVTLKTDADVGQVYFRLRMEVKLYECWKLDE
ncbi:hypothetical protein BUALT_Bualt05G0022400 [Buddleja alternifolia]|uniref:Dirigent protein n=1 Tax=Buddleja alternifolia TaxID=168488 RepID=A0AAV6XSC6_9LAMI|nr:hypothetical protein BUALT_Bualt05G0022400 [Buddleja alternifolia]